MLTAEDIENKITESFPDAKVRAKDLTGGGDHWQVSIHSKKFEGHNMVQQHQMVYRALGEWMHGAIHALSIKIEE